MKTLPSCYLFLWMLALVELFMHSSASIYEPLEEDAALEQYLQRTNVEATSIKGTIEILILRISDSDGNEPDHDATKLSDIFFGTHGNKYHYNKQDVATLYRSCSGGKADIQPATGDNIIDGVLEITIDVNLPSDTGQCANSVFGQYIREFAKANEQLGIKYKKVGYIPPESVCYGGGLGGGNSFIFFGGGEQYLELAVHEIGHTFGLHHSTGTPINYRPGFEYGDETCMMGCCKNAQQMCFNAPKSWELGWYNEGLEELQSFDKHGVFYKVDLVGFDDYVNGKFDESQHRVIVRVRNFFISFNRAKGINSGTRAYSDQVVIYKQSSRRGKSLLVGAYTSNSNEANTFFDLPEEGVPLAVKVCGIDIQNGNNEGSADYASIIVYTYDDGNEDLFSCGAEPSVVPEDVKLTRSSEQCIEEEPIGTIPRRFMCPIESTSLSKLPGGYGNPGLYLYARKHKAWGCTIALQPVHWAWNEKEFYFESSESLSDINDCFRPGFEIESTLPENPKTIPDGIILIRNDDPCIFENANPGNYPARFMCQLESTVSTNLPSGYDNPSIQVYGEDCSVELSPVHWSWEGTQFYFTSAQDLETINNCFGEGVHLTEFPPFLGPTPTEPPTMSPTKSSTKSPTKFPTKSPTKFPTNSPTKSPTKSPMEPPAKPCKEESQLIVKFQAHNQAKKHKTKYSILKKNSNGKFDKVESQRITKNGKLYEKSYCIEKNHCYQFVAQQKSSSGICCENGNGYYSLTIDGKLHEYSLWENGKTKTYNIGECAKTK